MMPSPEAGRLKYHRVLLKVGGEALSGPQGFGIDPDRAAQLASAIARVKNLGVQVAVVIGGGNIWRGTDGLTNNMDRGTADYMGMLATVMNSLALQDALERDGFITRVQTAIEMREIAEPFIRRRAVHQLEKGYIVILGAGTGNPYFTTDTAGALRANELDCDAMIKATKVDAVYAEDPRLNPQAERFEHLSYIDALNMRLKVMDSTAVSLCMDNNLPIHVVDLWQPHALEDVVLGKPVGTMIGELKTKD